MLKTRIIPCLLFRDRTIVKSVQFANHRMIGDPTTVARVFNQRNADELIFLDIKASRDSLPLNFKTFEDIARECFMPLAMGGGIRSVEDADRLFAIGADKIVINSCVTEHADLVERLAAKFGSQAVVASIDAKRTNGRFTAYSRCGRFDTQLSAVELAIRAQQLGAGEIFLTSIDQDGTMNGYDLDLLRAVCSTVEVPVIASGGCGKLEHLRDALDAGADAVSAASIFYFEGESIITIKEYLHSQGRHVRLLKEQR